MVGMCSHSAGILACTVDRKKLRVFLVHDTKSFNLFKRRYDDIINDEHGRKPVLLVDGVSIFKMVAGSGLDLSKFVIVLCASYKTISMYKGIEALDIDESGAPVSLTVAQINRKLLTAKPGFPNVSTPTVPEQETDTPELTEQSSHKTAGTSLPKALTKAPFVIKPGNVDMCLKLQLMTMEDLVEIQKAYHAILRSSAAMSKKKRKAAINDSLDALIRNVSREVQLGPQQEVDLAKKVTSFIFSAEKPVKLANALKESLLPARYALKVAAEANNKRRPLRKAFFLLKNGTDVKRVLARTGVCLEDVLYVFTFVESSLLLRRGIIVRTCK